jgi:Fur family transcriptional regulator, stress-responsive regulator
MTDADRSRAAGLREIPARRPVPGPARDGRDHRYRHYAVCRQCGAVAGVSVAGPVPGPPPAAGAWTLAGEAEVTFWGRCARCRDAGDGAAPR